MRYTVKTAGDQSIIINFGEQINEQTSQTVQKLSNIIESNGIIGVEEVVLGYTTLLINYVPTKISYDTLLSTIKVLLKDIALTKMEERNTIEIPVLYGNEMGPDLVDVAKLNHLAVEEVIKLHTEPDYSVYFLGFSPGFPFLGGLNEKIATPRLENPRKKVQAGSVGIANYQTGIYPVTSPGGWRIIGHTPIPLFNSNDADPFLLSPGDIIKFKSITKKEYDEIINSRP
ncbi:5-oxoprolinase subunit PxpB [Paucisalibacillus sp. EB02]|uniref:5-oxoprolinase subunit PxpB n=1 Tax=Paucisalibacillus sp. EB02 TaxID=1347087 RepID=UPI0004BCCA69|nr:5-oxoprolinase subunit PxpB [Paucisalibacillus sp. EB02]